MWQFFRYASLLALIGVTATGLFSKDKITVLRWVEGQPGCTFSADDDGLYRYGLWTNDFGVVMAVDADELRKASHRTEPAFGVLLTLRYRGTDLLAVNPEDMSLEFVKHEHDMHRAIAS